ncbi:MAG: hydroxyacylglutathione hydrolase [Salinarimonadaceae bacterium]|nr:MAG: hydroxyacylglutathione hydrolase [Salinarimonadaceae bacterium]
MNAELHLFRCLNDNVGALIRDPETGACASIDAPEAPAVDEALAHTGWRLTDILVTHGHQDHVQGVGALKERHGARVVAPAACETLPGLVDVAVREGDSVTLGGLAAQVWETPGHCADHVVFHFADDKLLVAGDVLFVMGCGRVFGGDYASLFTALERVRALPEDTRAIVGHDYTLANARFALKADPDNAALRERAARAETEAASGSLWGMTTIGEEKATNPFLRAQEPALAASVGMAGADPSDVFRALREWKNKG